MLAGKSVFAWGNWESGQTGIVLRRPRRTSTAAKEENQDRMEVDGEEAPKKENEEVNPSANTDADANANVGENNVVNGHDHQGEGSNLVKGAESKSEEVVQESEKDRSDKPEAAEDDQNDNEGQEEAALNVDFMKPNKFTLNNVIDIFTGASHSFLVAKDKRGRKILKGWGLNNYEQLGFESELKTVWNPTEVKFFRDIPVKYITGGDHHTILLTTSNEVYAWGKNDEGQCGIENQKAYVLNAERDDYTIKKPQKIIFPSSEENDKAISQICSYMNFSYAFTENDNNVFSWGLGESYVLGNKKDSNENVPFAVPKDFYQNLNVDQVRKFF